MEDLIKIEDESKNSFEEEEFAVYRGWSEELAEQLVVHSREPEMIRWVPRDASQRFRDVDSAHEWYRTRRRVVYALARRAMLDGIAWFSEEQKEGYDADHTFAIRMYEGSRGRGLAGRFMEVAHRNFERQGRSEHGIWLETDERNTAALHLYESHCYVMAGKSKAGRITMVRQVNAFPVSKTAQDL